ncbi:threonine/serine exporter family protein [Clostridium weizhouense]|uniref:Threonine/serine exporter family protein n=1 Tax=Clostridium weizhouense TaxID=2859781 RepID=A0ABS7ALZ8_9CLOT|nr:threonine/serine exporter family protein [Clostridium weizhouense]MBW6409436.1 threonine/serine exporter family protein [Clostridium weizhouense]
MLIKMTMLAFLGSVFPVILFNIDRRKIIWTGIAGAFGWIIYSIIFEITSSQVISSFWGAFAVNIYSEFMARKKKTPASMFYIPGIFPLVPGITAYSTISYIVENNFNDALNKGILTLSIGGAIAFGIMLSSTVVRFISKLKFKWSSN